MATKKKIAKQSKKNGKWTKKLSARSDFKGTETFIGKNYPQFLEAVQGLGAQFEVISPEDARLVNGYVMTLLGHASKERTSDLKAFNKEKRVAKLDERDAKMKEQMAENARLRKELTA